MDQKKLNAAIDRIGSESTEELVALYEDGGDGQTDEFREAIRRILAVRGVPDPTGYRPIPIQESQAGGLGGAAFAVLGGIVGGLVGYLIGKPPLVSFGDVLSRGTTLTGLDALLRPAAESAFNWMLAGVIVGAAAGLAMVYLKSTGSALSPTTKPPSNARACVHCGASVPAGMQFCGKCGRPVEGVVCPACGRTPPPDQNFCGGCGAKLS
jgi:predicted nucleic acid-binding Zn ribbon protein